MIDSLAPRISSATTLKNLVSGRRMYRRALLLAVWYMKRRLQMLGRLSQHESEIRCGLLIAQHFLVQSFSMGKG
jgi:hypothetical protein